MKPLYVFEILIGVLLALIVLSLFNIFYLSDDKVVEEDITGLSVFSQETIISDLSLEGYTQVDITVSPGIVQLSNDCKAIIMNTSPDRSYAIKKAIDGDVDYRPLFHDTVDNILDNYEIEVLMVKIIDLNDEIYFSSLFLNQNNKIVNLDTRPTDAIALAIKAGKPIYVKNSLFVEEIC